MIINFRLDKISIQKKNKPSGPVEAKNNLKVVEMTEESISALTKEKALNLKFTFTVNYEPNIANLEIEGSVTYMNDQKTVKEIFENWKKNKKIDQEVATPIFNHILSKCNIKALKLEEDVELPFHIPIPRLMSKSGLSAPSKPLKAS